MPNPFSTFSSLSAQSRSAEGKAALADRAKIMQLCDASGQAVVTPAACGSLPHAQRCAIAIRIARANGCEELAMTYATLLATMGAGPQVTAIADGAGAADALERALQQDLPLPVPYHQFARVVGLLGVVTGVVFLRHAPGPAARMLMPCLARA